jgi:hypothetical protein
LRMGICRIPRFTAVMASAQTSRCKLHANQWQTPAVGGGIATTCAQTKALSAA